MKLVLRELLGFSIVSLSNIVTLDYAEQTKYSGWLQILTPHMSLAEVKFVWCATRKEVENCLWETLK